MGNSCSLPHAHKTLETRTTRLATSPNLFQRRVIAPGPEILGRGFLFGHAVRRGARRRGGEPITGSWAMVHHMTTARGMFSVRCSDPLRGVRTYEHPNILSSLPVPNNVPNIPNMLNLSRHSRENCALGALTIYRGFFFGRAVRFSRFLVIGDHQYCHQYH
jgi:hypothetical protein